MIVKISLVFGLAFFAQLAGFFVAYGQLTEGVSRNTDTLAIVAPTIFEMNERLSRIEGLLNARFRVDMGDER